MPDSTPRLRWLLASLIVLVLPVPRVLATPGVHLAATPVAARAAGEGSPWINMSDARHLRVTYEGPEASSQLLREGGAQPLALASADFDEDGVPDLAGGYATPYGGLLTLHRGNVDSIWPNAKGASESEGGDGLLPAPFLPRAQVFDLPAAPHFLGAGDFDADGHMDLAMAGRGGEFAYLLRGDGGGSFDPPQTIDLPGAVTALVVGEINRRDGLADVVVGVDGEGGPRVLVFEGPEGALRREPEVFAAPAQVAGLALGQLDEHYPMDLAVAAGNRLLIVHGRDRKLSLDASQRATVPSATIDTATLPFSILDVALGDFSLEEDYRLELALLADNGSLLVFDPTSTAVVAQSDLQLPISRLRSPDTSFPSPRLVRSNVSSMPTDDLVLVDAARRQVHIVVTAQEREGSDSSLPESYVVSPWSATVDVAGVPAAVLPMRLNEDALSDLVMLNSDPVGLAVGLTSPVHTFVVATAQKTVDVCAVGDGVCAETEWVWLPGGVRVCEETGPCSLHSAVQEANAGAGMDTISVAVQAISYEGAGATFDTPVTFLGNGVQLGPNVYISFQGNASGSVVRDCVWQRLSVTGVVMGQDNSFVEGNQFGTVEGGTGWSRPALSVAGAGTTVGGTTASAGNTFSGVQEGGSSEAILLGEGPGIRVQGNHIGTGASANADWGIDVVSCANCTIGGTTGSARNFISLASGTGIQLSGSRVQGNLVQGNHITGDVGSTMLLDSATSSGLLIHALASGNTIGGVTSGAGNTISGFQSTGVLIDGDVTDTRVQGNRIGTDPTGSTALGNGGDGVMIQAGASDNTIGGTEGGAENVISGNAGNGIHITDGASDNRIQGNLIGTDKDGGERLPNQGHGILLDEGAHHNRIGGVTDFENNVVSGNEQCGIAIVGADSIYNEVLGNNIGVDIEGRFKVENHGNGVLISNASHNVVGGTEEVTLQGACTGSCNVVSGNQGNGIAIQGAEAAHNKVQGNIVGLAADGWERLVENQGNGVLITNNAHDNTIGGTDEGARNVISENAENGLAITAGVTNNTVVANWIGLDALGTRDAWTGWLARPNGADGILIADAPANKIGLPVAEWQNVISANGDSGIEVRGAGSAGTSIKGNLVGLLPSGDGILGNEHSGVFINDTPSCEIGGSETLERNVVSGNERGIVISGENATGNTVVNNCIGLDGLCNGAMRAQATGVLVQDASRNTVGGAEEELRNVIGGAIVGIEISGVEAYENNVWGNYIGTNKEGEEARLIGEVGVHLNGAPRNSIGGSIAGQGNLISGSTWHGVKIDGESATDNRIQGNFIGTTKDGYEPMPNHEHGVYITGSASDNVIGGTTEEEANIIAFNVQDGIFVESGERNAILGNEIFANQGLGIDLAPDGPTTNDVGDADTGANGLQNCPLVTAHIDGGSTVVSGILLSQPLRTYHVEIFANPQHEDHQGEDLLDVLDVSTDGSGLGRFQRTFAGAHSVVAATATDQEGNTSEFSVPPIIVNHLGDQGDASAADGVCDAEAGQAGEQCTLRAAIEEANRRSGRDLVMFDIVTANGASVDTPTIHVGTSLPDIVGPLVLDASTQPGGTVRLDGSGAGEGADGLRAFTPDFTLIGMVVMGFGGDGIQADAGASLARVEIRDNGAWGIRAGGTVEVGDYLVVDGNGEGGIRMDGGSLYATDLQSVQVTNNLGDGIRSIDGYVSLENAEVAGNREDGVDFDTYLQLYGSCRISGNRKGIVAVGGELEISGHSLEVVDNRDWGIYLWGGNVVVTDYGIGADIRVANNGSEVPNAGGMHVKGTILLADAGSLEVENNNGHGICGLLGSYVTVDDAIVRGNAGDGIRVQDGQLCLFGDVRVQDNSGHGIYGMVSAGTVMSGRSLEVTGNGGWGIRQYGAYFETSDEAQGAHILVSNNGQHTPGAGGLYVRGNTFIGDIATMTIAGNNGHGIESLQGTHTSVDNADIHDNAGDGINVRDGHLNVYGQSSIRANGGCGICSASGGEIELSASSLEIVDNAHWGISAAGHLITSDEAWGATVRVDSNGQGSPGAGGVQVNGDLIVVDAQSLQVHDNNGHGLLASGAGRRVHLDRASVQGNSGNGIDVQGSLKLFGENTINDNEGHGINSWSDQPVILGQAEICGNGGYGIVVGGQVMDQGSLVCENGQGGYLLDSSSAGLTSAAKLDRESHTDTSVISGAMIIDNLGDGIRLSRDVALTVMDSNISDNAGFAIANQFSGTVVFAQGNWWGDGSGPGGSGPGTGDETSGNVDYAGWRTEPAAMTIATAEEAVQGVRGAGVDAQVGIRNWLVPTDTVTVTVTDSRGWIVAPTERTLTLAERGSIIPVGIAVPDMASIGETDAVTVTATSHSNPDATDTDSFQVVVALVADLSLAKTVAPTDVAAGELITYTLVLANDGPDVATGVRLTDSLPAALLFASAASEQGSCSFANDSLVCDLEEIAAGAGATVTLVARVVAGDAVGDVTNRAAVTANEFDPYSYDNDDSVTSRTWLKAYLPLLTGCSWLPG